MHWRIIPFMVVLALLVGWAHVYLYRRLFRDTSTDPRWRRVGRISLWVLGLSAIGARFITALLPRGMTRPVQGIGWFWLALAIYLLLTLAALDLVRWVLGLFRRGPAQAAAAPVPTPPAPARAAGAVVLQGDSASLETTAKFGHLPAKWKRTAEVVLERESASPAPVRISRAATFARRKAKVPAIPDSGPEMARRVFLARAAGAGALAVAGGASAFGIFRAYYPPAVSEVPIRLRGLPRELDGFTIVQLSDVHAGQSVHEAWMGELADRCAAMRPDLFVVTGDLVDGSVSQLGGIVARLQKVQARQGTWFVTGNHDYYAGADAWCAALHKMGMQILRNRRVVIGGGPGEPSLDLIGVDDWGLRDDGTGYDLDHAVEGREPDRPAVLLAHRPNGFDRAAALGIGLQLSGHTHGGQTFPFTAVARLIWPRCAGLFEKGDSRMYVSRGVGFVGPPLRAGSPPEIVRITLLA